MNIAGIGTNYSTTYRQNNMTSFEGLFKRKQREETPEQALERRKKEGKKQGNEAYQKTLSKGSFLSLLTLAGFLKVKENVTLDEVKKVADVMVKENNLAAKGFTYHFIDNSVIERGAARVAKKMSQAPWAQNVRNKIPFTKGQQLFDWGLKQAAELTLTFKSMFRGIGKTSVQDGAVQVGEMVKYRDYGKLVEKTAIGIGESPTIKPIKYLLDKAIKNPESKKTVFGMMHQQFKMMSQNLLFMVKKGLNAFYMPEGNFSITAKKRASLMMHEIGHAINANKSNFAKNLTIGIRFLPKVATALLLANAITHSAKYEQGENRNKVTKIKDFFEANAAKLAFLSFVPMICEEALATGHGLKYAKKVLGSGKMGTFRKLYAFGLASYIGAAALTSFAVKQASEQRDKVVYELDKK